MYVNIFSYTTINFMVVAISPAFFSFFHLFLLFYFLIKRIKSIVLIYQHHHRYPHLHHELQFLKKRQVFTLLHFSLSASPLLGLYHQRRVERVDHLELVGCEGRLEHVGAEGGDQHDH